MSCRSHKFLIAALLVLGLSSAVLPSVFAEEGKDYTRIILGKNQQGDTIYQWSPHPERIIDSYIGTKPVYKDYRIMEDVNRVYVETANSGSFVFDKQTCTYNLHSSGYLNEQNNAKIKNISWTVKGKAAAASNWSNVNSINNANCNVTVQTTPSTVKIIGEKANSVGKFQIVLDYVPGQGIKETMRAFNNNTNWTNHNIGFTETFEVPQYITIGKQTYNLANQNNTTFDRAWLDSNTRKLVRFSNAIDYDFGIGWDNLNDIKIVWDGTKAKLILNYLYPTSIVPYQQWFEVDPTFNQPATTGGRVYNGVGAADCAVIAVGGADATTFVEKFTGANGCQIAWFEWDITSIPTGAVVNNVIFEWDQSGTTNWAENCQVYMYATQPSTLTSAQKVTQGWASPRSGTTSSCTSDGANKQLSFNSTGIANVQANISGAEGWWGGMFQALTSAADGTNRFFTMDAGQTRLYIVYSYGPPDAVDDLTATALNYTAVFLDWTQPSLNGGTLSGYRINYTTPYGNPLTIIINNTGTSTSSATISGLTELTPYSFRVTAVTTLGKNVTGATIANVTTPLQFQPANFTIGYFDIDVENAERAGIIYERNDINSTRTVVSVIYDEDYTLDCNILYQLQQTNSTYLNITGSTYSTIQKVRNFTFINPGNDIIRMTCVDRDSNDTARYMLTQDGNFTLLDMIENFRNGTYGTMGLIGSLDLITLLIIIGSMIGFNRVNETVGVIFNVFLIGVLAYFEIIEFPTIFFGALALIIMLVIGSTKKD